MTISAKLLTLKVGPRTLLQNACFSIGRAEFIAVLGRNGAGKTTLLRTLAGIRKPDGGCVMLDDCECSTLTPAQRATSIAHMAGDDLFMDRLTVRDVVAMGRYAHHHWWQWHEQERDGEIVTAALRDVAMESFEHRRFDTLSSGERQRIWLALGLAQEAGLLMLDEPTSHLDVRVAHEILQLLRAQVAAGKTVICVLHDLNEALEFADKLLVMTEGRIAAFDAPEAVVAGGILDDAYGMPMEVLRTPSGALRLFPLNARQNGAE